MYPCLRCGTVLVGNPRRHDIKDLTSTDPCQFVPQGLQRTTGVLFEPKAAENPSDHYPVFVRLVF